MLHVNQNMKLAIKEKILTHDSVLQIQDFGYQDDKKGCDYSMMTF
jgi:hypothetical protein